jgi:2-methylcitrate dehydratase PrpD
MRNAFGIAGSCAAGLMAAQEGAMVKRLHAGRAGESGVRAAELASRGFTGISDIFEAPYGGFLSSLARTPKPEKLTAGLGETWETLNTGFKMYPTVTSIHAALDSLRRVMADAKLAAEDIERIEVGIGHMTYVHCAWTYKPAGITAAQMNLFYGLAVTALAGQVTAAAFTEDRLAAPEIMAMIGRISAHEDPELEAMGAAFRHAARLVVHTKDGRTLRHEELHRRASPENPVTPAEVEAKFRANLEGILTRDEQDVVVKAVEGFEHATDFAPLLAVLGAKR